MDDGHELLCRHLFLLQLISFPTKKAMDLKIHSLESRKKSTTVTRQQKKSRDFFQNYCISVTSISADSKLHVKLVICFIWILQSCVSRSRIFSLLDPISEFSKLDPKPITLPIISCSKRHIKFLSVRLEFH